MNGIGYNNSSLRLGRWRDTEWRLHVHFPLLTLVVLLGAQYGLFSFRQAWCGMGVLAFSVFVHEATRWIAAHRMGGRTRCVLLGPTGGWTQPKLPADPTPLLFSAMSGLTSYIALAVTAACGLAMTGEGDTLRLLALWSPEFRSASSLPRLLAELTVWVNGCLFVLNLAPVRPCDGAEAVRGLLWPLVGPEKARMAIARLALAGSAVLALAAVWLRDLTLGGSFPVWFPLALASTLMGFSGGRAWIDRGRNRSLTIDELDSDDDQWLHSEWIEDDRAAVLVEQVQEKQQEAIDRKRQEREDQEDAQVDDILLRLRVVSFNELSEEEQTILKRASRRYRRRLGERPS